MLFKVSKKWIIMSTTIKKEKISVDKGEVERISNKVVKER